MSTIQGSADSNLLTYSINTLPSPLQVSPASGNPAEATISIVVSNNSYNPVYCNKITFTIPLGTLAQDLSPDDSSIILSASPAGQWSIAKISGGVFEATPLKPEFNEITTDGLMFQLKSISMNQQVGTAILSITEYTSLDNASFSSKSVSSNLGKFPYNFFFTGVNVSVPQIDSGDPVTLTWNGSDGATYNLRYADQSIDVSQYRTWTSPPLFNTTAFTLTATVSQGGQLVSISHQAVVIVVSPQILTFFADPSEISYNEVVTLNWRALDADGVYLITGQSGRETLPAVSDPSNPKTITPQWAQQYSLQAFKNNPDGSVGQLSAVTPLTVTFKPLIISSFTATPTVVDLQNQSTTLAWQVLNAKTVTLQSTPVTLSGTQVENPVDNSTYQLVATWADGQTTQTASVAVQVVRVTIVSANASFQESGSNITATLTFEVGAATGGTVTGAHLMFCTRHHWYRWGQNYQTPDQSATITQVSDTQWQATLTFSQIPGNWLAVPNIGLQYSATFNGFQPAGISNQIFMYKGSFSFWNGT